MARRIAGEDHRHGIGGNRHRAVGFSIYGKGLHALRQGRLNISALMSVAVTGAFIIGQWPEAAMVMALYSVAEAIEARAVDQTWRDQESDGNGSGGC